MNNEFKNKIKKRLYEKLSDISSNLLFEQGEPISAALKKLISKAIRKIWNVGEHIGSGVAHGVWDELNMDEIRRLFRDPSFPDHAERIEAWDSIYYLFSHGAIETDMWDGFAILNDGRIVGRRGDQWYELFEHYGNVHYEPIDIPNWTPGDYLPLDTHTVRERIIPGIIGAGAAGGAAHRINDALRTTQPLNPYNTEDDTPYRQA